MVLNTIFDHDFNQSMKMTRTIDECSLVKLLQTGNVLAFDSLFELYSLKLYHFTFKYLKNESESEELVQEVFVQLWEHRQSLKSELSFKSYLFTIALNLIRKYFNKKAVSLKYLESLRSENDSILPEALLDEHDESVYNQIKILIDQMPPRRREIFIKSKLEGKSSREIATELNISAGTVDNQVSEGLRFIRSRIYTENIALLLFVCLFLS